MKSPLWTAVETSVLICMARTVAETGSLMLFLLMSLNLHWKRALTLLGPWLPLLHLPLKLWSGRRSLAGTIERWSVQDSFLCDAWDLGHPRFYFHRCVVWSWASHSWLVCTKSAEGPREDGAEHVLLAQICWHAPEPEFGYWFCSGFVLSTCFQTHDRLRGQKQVPGRSACHIIRSGACQMTQEGVLPGTFYMVCACVCVCMCVCPSCLCLSFL